ncbi:MAG: hypothetical protein LBL62_07340 [Planctomycetaceae bacterium]|jgi:pantoate kinase|nr:hypothetical protein [Planctomycetaceae bacterium]
MLNPEVIRQEGLRVLTENLGILEAEHFITIIKREPFNYTEWRQNFFKNVPLEQLLHDADNFRKQTQKEKEIENQ